MVFVFIAFALMVAIGGVSVGGTLQKASYTAVTVALNETEKTVRAYFREPKVAFDNIYKTVQNILDDNESQEKVRQYLMQTTDLLAAQEDGIEGFMVVYGYIRGEFLNGTDWIPEPDFVPQQRPWYQLAVRADDADYTAPYTDAETGFTIISLAQKLYGQNGDYYGVLALDINLMWLAGYAESLQFTDGGYGMIINQHLYIITHPQEQYAGTRLQDLGKDTGSDYAGIAEMLRTNSSVSAERIRDTDGTRAIIFIKKLYNGWYVGVVMPTKSYYADLYLVISLLAALGLVLACILSYILLRLSAQKIRSEEESRAKSSFLAMMSHEMRTPMNAITGMTNIAKSARDIEKKDYALGKIEDAANHLLGVINDILDMSKIEADKLELNPRAFDFEKLLKKVADIMNFRAVEKHQEFEVNIDEKIPKKLICDDQRLAQILTNLLSNAVKFTPEYGAITVSSKLLRDNGDVCIIQFDVSDTGVGISGEQQTRIFKPFEQAENTTTRKYGGTGLGLALTKRIVELMGGDISVSSELGKGSTFTFTAVFEKLGVGAEKILSDESQADESENADFSAYRVLLADDVEINREIVSALLEPTGLNIECAENGVQAFKMFEAAPDKYDMIFMDVQMPEMDGYEATRKIRALNIEKAKTVPIIAMTANVFKEDVDNCLKAGMNGHIGKPIDQKTVFEKIIFYMKRQ